MTDRFTRPGSMSDDDRALAGLERRRATPAAGVTIIVDDPDAADAFAQEAHFTPVGDVLAMTDDPELRNVITEIWRHVANVELRCRLIVRSSDVAELRKELDGIKATLVDISGKSGTNGKLGALKERVDKAEARRWWAVTFLAGVAVTVIGSAIAFGVWKGSIETDVKTLKRALYHSQGFSPDEPAWKDERP